MRRTKPNPTIAPSPPVEPPHRQAFPGLSVALDRLQEVAGYFPEFDEVRQRLDEIAAFAPLVRLTPRQTLGLSGEAAKVLGLQARHLREALGLTREQVAKRSGLADGTIRNFETGRHRQSEARIAWVLGALLPLAEGNHNLDPDLIADLRSVYSLAARLSNQPTIAKVTSPMTPDEPEKPSEPEQPKHAAWGRAVQRRREALGMTQHELASRAGLSMTALKGIESGQVEPSAKQRQHIGAVIKEAEEIQRLERR